MAGSPDLENRPAQGKAAPREMADEPALTGRGASLPWSVWTKAPGKRGGSPAWSAGRGHGPAGVMSS